MHAMGAKWDFEEPEKLSATNVAEGLSVASFAQDLDVSDQTICNWRRQDRIDRGEVPGLTTTDHGELSSAKKRIASRQPELVFAGRAVEILKEEASPKRGVLRSK